MRSIILVISGCFVLAIAFLVYYWTLPAPRPPAQQVVKPTTQNSPNFTNSKDTTLNSDGVWINHWNDQTGELSYRFRAKTYDRQLDGRAKVTEPVVEFFLRGSGDAAEDASNNRARRLQITGRDGIITIPNSERGKTRFGQTENTQSPSSGLLYDVTVRLFNQTEGGDEILNVTMNNARFDNESFTIVTGPYTDPSTRQNVPADQVKVVLRGRDYDLDGRGLTIKWNDRDRRLQLLEIAHGETLVLKNTQKFSMDSSGPGASRRDPLDQPASFLESPSSLIPDILPVPQNSVAPAPAMSLVAQAFTTSSPQMMAPVILIDQPEVKPPAVRQPRNPAGVAAPPSTGRVGRPVPISKPRLKPNNEPPLYQATFFDDVHITQEDKELITAQRMIVHFLMEDDDAPATKPAHPSSKPLSEPEPRSQLPAPRTSQPVTLSAIEPATLPAATSPAARARPRSHRATQEATTQPGGPPIVVHWTGPLRVVPLHMDEAIPPGQQVVTFEGAPVVARQEGSEIRSARLTYHTEDGQTFVESAPNSPVLMTRRENGAISTIHASSATYYRDRQLAILRDKGSADLPVESQTAQAPELMHATWSKSCTLHFMPGTEGRQMAIDSADLEGDVRVRHPQIRLTSQSLSLMFQPAGEAGAPLPPTTRAIATAPATLPIRPPVRVRQNADDARSPSSTLRQLIARGDVHCLMIDPQKKQTIDCDQLTVLTAPMPDGRVVARNITADGNVHTVDPDEDLWARHLDATLAPSTRPAANARLNADAGDDEPAHGRADSSAPSLQLESLYAAQDVRVLMKKDGSIATSDTLMITTQDGKSRIKLNGAPEAKIVSKQNTIIGSIIDIFPDGQLLNVDGPGTMHGIQQDSAKSPGKPIDISWSRSARYDGKGDRLDCLGTVHAASVDADGTRNLGTGDRMIVNFVPSAAKPATMSSTQPATNPASAPIPPQMVSSAPATTIVPSATEPATLVADQATPARIHSPATAPTSAPSDATQTLLGNKAIHDITFTDHAEVHSVLADAGGNILRNLDLFADKIEYSIDASTGKPIRRIDVPVPGRMLFEDHRPATQPASDKNNPNSPSGDSRGSTAFQWSRSMTYDDATQKMVMQGVDLATEKDKVIVDHLDDTPNAQPTRISALTITADIIPAPPTTRPATLPTTAQSPALDPVEAINPATAGTTRALASATMPSTAPASDIHMEVKHMTAFGNVILNSKNGDLHADRMDYDPPSHLVKAFGSPHYPAVFTPSHAANQNPQPLIADELQWDLEQSLPKATGATALIRK